MTDLTTAADRHRISGPTELLQAVPYLLGFHPRRSIVLVGLADRLLTVTARLDLADVGVADLLSDTMSAMARGGSATLVALVYADSPGDRDGWTALATQIRSAAGRCGLGCDDVLLVAHGRWRSLACVTPQCCPPEGRPIGAAVSAFAAAATLAGVAPLADRESLAQTLAPVPERRLASTLLAAAVQAADRARDEGGAERYERAVKRRLFASARDLPNGVGAPPEGNAGAVDEQTAAAFGVALRSVPVRDAVWLAVDDGRLDGRGLWRDLAQRLPVPYDAVPLFLHGWVTWRAGDGALASIAVNRAVAADPECMPGLLLQAAIAQAVDPRRLPRLRPARKA